MIDTEKIKADIALGRESILPTQSFHDQNVIYNARSACVRHAADLLEERDHLLHPSQGEVVTYQSRIDALAAALGRVSEERDALREERTIDCGTCGSRFVEVKDIEDVTSDGDEFVCPVCAAERFHDHSVTLNRLLWKIAEELGRAVDGGWVDPDDLVETLVDRLRGVRALVEATWPMPPEAAGSFYLPTPMFDSAQRRELRRALGDPES